MRFRLPKKEKHARLASLVLLASAVMFNLHITSPLLADGVNDSGDDQYHFSHTYYLRKLILEEHMIFGFVHSYGTGYPWFNAHQFLMYLIVAALNILSLDAISLLSAHNLMVVLIYSLYPLSVYYALDKFKMPPIMCGIAALLSALPISGWGHTTTAYFVLGLTSQVLGAFIFPLALGSFHETVREGKGIRRTSLLFTVTFFAHPYYAYFLIIVGFLDLLFAYPGLKRKDLMKPVKHALTAGALTFLMSMFWILPLTEHIQYAPRNLRMQAVKSSFSVDSALSAFYSGELLDVSDNFGFDADKHLRWPKNMGRGRLPVLTALTSLGLAYALASRRRFGLFCATGAVIAFLFFVGKDDITLLRLLPFSDFLNPKRTIYLLEFFSITLSANVLYWILSSIPNVSKRVLGSRKVGYAMSYLILLAVLYTPYNERLITSEKEVETIDYWINSLKNIGEAMDRDGFDGRVYGDTDTGVKSAPVVLSQPWLYDRPYFRRIYSTRFWGDLTNYESIFHIFNIRYLVTSSIYDVPPNLEGDLTKVYSDRQYSLFRYDGDFSYAFLSHKQPALLSSTEEGWRRIAEVWLHYYKNNSRRDHIPLIVEYTGQAVDPSRYSYLMRYDREPHPILVAAFEGKVFNGTEQPHNTVRRAIKERSPQDRNSRTTVVKRSIHAALIKVEADEPGLLIYKMRYHPYWRVEVDGVRKDTLRVTPEYPGVFIEPGTHLVEFNYVKPLSQHLLNAISFMAFFLAVSPRTLLSRLRSFARTPLAK
ncbi:MAG: hypothetical protein GF416_05925 [Candidatus Altiarchaeales archaeon]|nr:hypothetical protein [Candidatus Altiarchaeales archaeon]MBD3416653.1 hypothetical protein [Candidatus Altiarchaeales archaeon]